MSLSVMAVVDVYDALSTARAYKPALPPEECFSLLETQVDEGWWDPRAVKALIQVIKEKAFSTDWNQLDSLAVSAATSAASK